jgi:glycosyltransferase involved in cell wall biosynthesis
MNPKVSIIVPVYNVEKYITRCLDSILAQTFTDFECILVDDASPDNCPMICNEYAKKDKQFKVIHKTKNEGLPKARRSGLDIASGDFIMHVDSDDWLEPDALEKLYKKQCETNADIVIGSFTEYHINKTHRCIFNNYIIKNKKEMLFIFFKNSYKNVWGKLYRSSLFENIKHPSNLIYGEDAIVNTQIICSNGCKIISVIKDNIYNYDCSSGGISQGLTCSEENAINYFQSHIYIYNYLKQEQLLYGDIRKYFYIYLFSSIYVKLFYNVPKIESIKLIRKENLPFFYFSDNIKIIVYSLINCIFIINQNLYKFIIKNYYNFRNKI